MKKVNASAIYYALFLSVIFALLLGGLLLFAGFNKNLATRLEIQQLVIDNAHSGIAFGQTNFKSLKNNTPLKMRLFNDGIDSVEITKKQWGAFTILKSTGVHKKVKHTKIALLGASTTTELPNLYMADNGRPLSVCGTTKIEGEAFIPTSGIKRAYISGQNYQGEKLLYGTKKTAKKNIPPVRNNFLSALTDWGGDIQIWDNQTDSIQASFNQNAIHFIADGNLNLANKFINGHVIIEAKDSIYIDKSTQINHAIIKAKRIYIANGFTGQFQAFVSERITLEKNVQLTYPSVVGLTEINAPKTSVSQIILNENAQILGTVFLLTEKPDFRKLPLLKIAEKSEIDGFIYCQGKTELKGKINGHLFTNKFTLKTPSSSHENHILNGEILDKLPPNFIVASLLKEEQQLKQIQWLN